MSLRRLMCLVRLAMEDAELIQGADGPLKKRYVIEAVRSLAEAMDEDDANLINALVPYVIDLVVVASRGGLTVNTRKVRCFDECF